MDFMAENAVKVLEKVSLKDVPGAAMVRIGGEDKRIADSSTNSSIIMNELIAMRVSRGRIGLRWVERSVDRCAQICVRVGHGHKG